MRIWSLHPRYLDSKGLVALWRETLLAKHVLLGQTKGYKNHPQLNRFKVLPNPVDGINQYLSVIYENALLRGYKFDKTKVDWDFKAVKMSVTKGQLDFERKHLLSKLEVRDPKRRTEVFQDESLESHPIFQVLEGEMEDWEIKSY